MVQLQLSTGDLDQGSLATFHVAIREGKLVRNDVGFCGRFKKCTVRSWEGHLKSKSL